MSKPVNSVLPVVPGRNPLLGIPAPPRFQGGAGEAKFELPVEAPASPTPPGRPSSAASNNGGAGEALTPLPPLPISPLRGGRRGDSSSSPTPEGRLNSRTAAGGGGGAPKADPKLQEATREWEAFFVGYLLKQMRKTAGNEGGLFAPSEGEKMFRDMLDDETARSLSKTGGLGLADMLNQELGSAHARQPAEDRKR